MRGVIGSGQRKRSEWKNKMVKGKRTFRQANREAGQAGRAASPWGARKTARSRVWFIKKAYKELKSHG